MLALFRSRNARDECRAMTKPEERSELSICLICFDLIHASNARLRIGSENENDSGARARARAFPLPIDLTAWHSASAAMYAGYV